MIESQGTICNWADETFGFCSRQAAMYRMFVEVEELKDVNKDDFEKVSNECADILITLYRVAHCYNFDLHATVDHKMQVNRDRKWKSNGDGTGQHIKE